MLQADLHIHSNFSRDAESKPIEIVETALRSSIDVISITDHDSLEGWKEVKRLVDEKNIDLLVVPGQEISTNKGHLLVLGVEEEPPSKELNEVISWTRDKQGVSIAPHPFQRYRHGLGKKVVKTVEPIDAVEVCNSRHLFSWGNSRAHRMANLYGYTKIGGSDAHIPEMVGQVSTYIDAEKGVKDILDSIRCGKTLVNKGKTPTPLFLKQLFGMMKESLTD